jgi:hypothetical protein
MNQISASVGKNGRNLAADVKTVQQLLKLKAFDPGGVDGICGQKTLGAIEKFQAKFLAHPDGLIEPGRTTWQRLAANPVAVQQWSGDSSQWSQEKKLASLTPALRPKVSEVLAALTKRGFQPKIFFGWRSVAVQLELLKKGNTTVSFSFHNAQKTDGTPDAHAADIIDSRYAWNAEAETSGFWKALGEEAKKQSLYWGGDWTSFRDWAHVQLLPNSHLAHVKRQSGL